MKQLDAMPGKAEGGATTMGIWKNNVDPYFHPQVDLIVSCRKHNVVSLASGPLPVSALLNASKVKALSCELGATKLPIDTLG
eukprot:5416448-Pyramimonas_sp.AAC.1